MDEEDNLVYILYCSKCGKMYKAVKNKNDIFITDFGDKISKCFCGGSLKYFMSKEWVGEKLFTIKGER